MNRNAIVFVAGLLLSAFPLLAQQQITVVRATYSGGDVQRDVTTLVSAQLQNGPATLAVNNHTFGGDPAFGKVKQLTVEYRFSGNTFTVSAKEGQTLAIPSPDAPPLPQADRAVANAPLGSAPKRTAPDGVFYLRQRISATTDSGITSIPPGTMVHRISEANGVMTVKAGDDQFEVQSSLLTNDLSEAGQVAAQYAVEAAQSAQVQRAEDQQAQQEENVQALSQADYERAQKEHAEKLKSAKLLRVFVVQVVAGGILSDQMEEDAPAGDSMSSIGGGGYVSAITSYSRSGDIIFVKGVSDAAENEQVKMQAYRDGTFSYTDTLGAKRTVEKWTAVK